MAYRPGARLAMHIHRAVMQGSLKEIVNNAGNSLVIQNATEDNDRVYLCVAGEGDGKTQGNAMDCSCLP